MYSQLIIDRNVHNIEKQLDLKLIRYPVGESLEFAEHLKKLWDPEDQCWKRHLHMEESQFIRNERLLCALDYSYWCRYCIIIRDPEVGGGLGCFEPWGAQHRILEVIAGMEEEQTLAFEQGEAVPGILLAAHKARQLGCTMLVRTLHWHRLTTGKGVRALAASVDDDKVDALYLRDKRIYDNLPSFLKPSIGFEEKARHWHFDLLDSGLLYQTLVQRAGLGQGEQYELGHITEAASDPNQGGEIEHNFTPTIPRAPSALHVLETTAQGRSNWWRFFVEDIRKGNSRWRLVFVPWYAELRKYRLQPPEGWQPSQVALLHAQKVYETSPEFVGHAVMLPKENLYWWDFTRGEYARKGNLNLFYTNFCATIEESFQHTTRSVFGSDDLEALRQCARMPVAYELSAGVAHE